MCIRSWRLTYLSATIAVLFAMTACGGGSSAPAPEAPAPEAPAPLFPLPTDGVTAITGQAVTASWTFDSETEEVDGLSPSGPSSSRATVTTEDDIVTAIDISAPGSSVSFAAGTGDVAIVESGLVSFGSADGENSATFASPSSAGFEFQTFGVWLTGFGTGSGSVGVGSYGLRTTETDLPTTSATYSGGSLGFARLADSQPYVTASRIDVSTDFSTVDISSTRTVAVNLNTNTAVSAPELNFTGSGAVSGAGFRADIAGSDTSGTANGIFYGPKAAEVGGTFQASGADGKIQYLGSFGGAKR